MAALRTSPTSQKIETRFSIFFLLEFYTIKGCVRPSVSQFVHWSVGPSVMRLFQLTKMSQNRPKEFQKGVYTNLLKDMISVKLQLDLHEFERYSTAF